MPSALKRAEEILLGFERRIKQKLVEEAVVAVVVVIKVAYG